MITEEYLLKPLSLGRTAIQEAAQCYRDWMPRSSFEADIAIYLCEGVVISNARCFGMARVIEGPRTGKPAWFVRMAVGPIDELINALPFVLDEICLCRGKQGDLRIRSYSMARMKQLTGGKVNGRRRSKQ